MQPTIRGSERRRGALVGAVILVAGFGAQRAVLAADPVAGERTFALCAQCHSLTAGESNLGPSLHQVVGRKAGTSDGFRYSKVMASSGITWTAAELDTFLADPQKRFPGSKMAFTGLPDAGQRADLIAFLESKSGN